MASHPDVRPDRPVAAPLLEFRLDEHHAAGPLTIQLLSGSVRFRAGAETRELRPGTLVALESALPHQMEALADSAFLLTLLQPS